ncbi:hypothetical protein DSO57_1022400 [Entomophthora muscae]|uniref:Uncharacterized protein n=1 Tax=Entomophthora muscae TaxID=34485 RepID=A0ACC2RHX6_9FUNG|nr:hypothetical protein DSO57_1022400 [Entomophthora muscae]
MSQHCPISSYAKGNPNSTNMALTPGALSSLVPALVPSIQNMPLLQAPLVPNLYVHDQPPFTSSIKDSPSVIDVLSAPCLVEYSTCQIPYIEFTATAQRLAGSNSVSLPVWGSVIIHLRSCFSGRDCGLAK